MDWKKTLGRVNTGAKIASAILDGKEVLNPDVIFAAAFDRRISTYQEFLEGWGPILYPDWRDFPALSSPKRISFLSEANSLRGYLYETPDPLGLVLCVHGINSLSNNHNAVFHDHFLRRGYDVLAIDLTSCGESDGLSIKGLHQSAIDVSNAISWIHRQSALSSLPICLFGHSWGGYGVTAITALDPSPVAVAAFSGFKDPWSMIMGLPENYVGEIAHIGESKVKDAYFKRAGKYAFLSAYDAIKANAEIAYLIVQGGDDDIVVPKAALGCCEFNRPNVRIITREGCGHNDLFYDERCRRYRKNVENARKTLVKEYGKDPKDIPAQAMEAFKSSFKREECLRLDEALFDEIDGAFFAACQGRRHG